MVAGLGRLESSESGPGSCWLQPGQTRAAWQNGASVVHLWYSLMLVYLQRASHTTGEGGDGDPSVASQELPRLVAANQPRLKTEPLWSLVKFSFASSTVQIPS